MMIRGARLVAALATIFSVAVGTVTAYAQGQPGAGQPTMADRMASAKASLKARYGFSDAQATTAIQKAQDVAKSFQPQLMTLQKKYGANPTPEQRQKMQMEALPLIAAISKKTNAVLLSVATKAQRPKIEAQMKMEQQQIDKMRAGGKP